MFKHSKPNCYCEAPSVHRRTMPRQSLTVQEYLSLYGNKPSQYNLYQLAPASKSADDVDPLTSLQDAKQTFYEKRKKIIDERNYKAQEYAAQQKLAQEKGSLSVDDVINLRKLLKINDETTK